MSRPKLAEAMNRNKRQHIGAKGVFNRGQRGASRGLHQRPAHGVVTHAQANLAHRLDRTEMRALKGMASQCMTATRQLRGVNRLGNQSQAAARKACRQGGLRSRGHMFHVDPKMRRPGHPGSRILAMARRRHRHAKALSPQRAEPGEHVRCDSVQPVQADHRTRGVESAQVGQVIQGLGIDLQKTRPSRQNMVGPQILQQIG